MGGERDYLFRCLEQTGTRGQVLILSGGFSDRGDVMNASWKGRLPLAVGAGLVVVAPVVLARWQPARA